MYNSFFGLKETPFSLTPDPRYLYLSPNHREAINHLLYGINERKGFILITGGIGAGKTTICRVLLNQLDKNTKSALILNSFISGMELLKMIVQEFGIETGPDKETKKDYIDALNNFLLHNFSNGGNAALLIDEAQNLTGDVLEQLRMLSNLETEKEKLIQIVLIGQPELSDIISSPSLRQLNERIAVRYDLRPLEYKDISAYVEHRLIVAGGHGDINFLKNAYKKIYNHSKGIPRRINSICDRALLIAYTNDRHTISGSIVKKAVKDLYGFRVDNFSINRRLNTKFILTSILVLLVLVTAVLTGMNNFKYLSDIIKKKTKIKDAKTLVHSQKVTWKIKNEPDILLNEKESISALFSLYYDNETTESRNVSGQQMSLVSYKLAPEYYVMLKKPFRLNCNEKNETGKYLIIIKTNKNGALCIDEKGGKREITRSFIYDHWGGVVSWFYPFDEGPPILQKGVSDPLVSKLQLSLQKIGYMVNLTGKYDESTFKAIKRFQEDFGLNPDGITGARTRALLYQMAG